MKEKLEYLSYLNASHSLLFVYSMLKYSSGCGTYFVTPKRHLGFSQCYLFPISYRHTTYFSLGFFLWFESNMVLLQSMLSETCCENNRLIRGMKGKVKGMVDAVTGLQTRSQIEAGKKVVEPSDGFGRRQDAQRGATQRCLDDATGAWDETQNNGWWVEHGQREPPVVSKERKTAIGVE